MPQHLTVTIASLPTTAGRICVQAAWHRTSYVLRLRGHAAALRALLADTRQVSPTARVVTLRPPEPITTLAAVETFFDTASAHWRVLRIGPFSEFAPGLPAQPLPSENPRCPAAP